MKHRATTQFWESYEKLPDRIRALADKNFKLLKADPYHPSLHFKKINNIWSVRVGANYRALGFDHDDCVLWFWIGTHTDYDRLIS